MIMSSSEIVNRHLIEIVPFPFSIGTDPVNPLAVLIYLPPKLINLFPAPDAAQCHRHDDGRRADCHRPDGYSFDDHVSLLSALLWLSMPLHCPLQMCFDIPLPILAMAHYAFAQLCPAELCYAFPSPFFASARYAFAQLCDLYAMPPPRYCLCPAQCTCAMPLQNDALPLLTQLRYATPMLDCAIQSHCYASLRPAFAAPFHSQPLLCHSPP